MAEIIKNPHRHPRIAARCAARIAFGAELASGAQHVARSSTGALLTPDPVPSTLSVEAGPRRGPSHDWSQRGSPLRRTAASGWIVALALLAACRPSATTAPQVIR